MSLLDALLLDPLRMNVWIAARADDVAGTGTQSDPLDGSTQAKFDALMNSMPVPITSITYNSGTNVATVIAISHPFANTNSVLIAGVTNSIYYNGTFSITCVDANTFTYSPSMPPPPTAQCTNISCRLSTTSGPVVPLPIVPPIAVHLGPGTFKTNGYYDSVSGGVGWQPRPGMKIVGSGIDVTVLQLAPSSTSNAHFYAVGHAISPGTSPYPKLPNLLDYFEISDLTIDSNLANYSGTSVACGAVRVMGNHARIRRLKLVNWGTKATTSPACYVASLVTASDLAWVEDCGIEECIAMSPASASNANPTTVFHAGGSESPPATPLAYGVAPYIRNCFVDAGEPSPFSPEIRGLSMAWCKAGIIEGNQAHNLTYGTFQQTTAAQDIVVRNNWFKNVNKGVLLGGLGASQGTGTLAVSSGIATVTIPGGHTVVAGDTVAIGTNPTTAYDGTVVTVLSSLAPTSTTFAFSTSRTVPATVSSVQKVYGVSNLTVEGNVVEMPTSTSGVLIGIHVQDGSLGTNPQDPNPSYATYLFGKVILRDNKLHYLDGVTPPPGSTYVGYAIQANSASDLLVRNNVVESVPANPIRNDRCMSVAYFNNQKPDGTLVQGYNADTGNSYEELATIADFALVMGLFNRKS